MGEEDQSVPRWKYVAVIALLVVFPLVKVAFDGVGARVASWVVLFVLMVGIFVWKPR